MSERNAPCPCGSGKRYKHCHGLLVSEAAPMDADLVDFVVAGAQRGGTTALDAYLREHPGVSMGATRKELHFFDHEEHFKREPVDYAGYHTHFRPRQPGQLRGDATPSYMYWRPAAQRLARYNPALKVIVILRDPFTRARSHWNKERQQGRETLSFLAALQAEAARAEAALPLQNRRTSYAERGLYVEQIVRLWQHFPRGQTLILRSEALQSAPAATLAQIAAFLGLPDFPAIAPRSVNARDYDRGFERAEWDYLAARFVPEIDALERLLGWDCSAWRSPPRATGTAEPRCQADGGT